MSTAGYIKNHSRSPTPYRQPPVFKLPDSFIDQAEKASAASYEEIQQELRNLFDFSITFTGKPEGDSSPSGTTATSPVVQADGLEMKNKTVENRISHDDDSNNSRRQEHSNAQEEMYDSQPIIEEERRAGEDGRVNSSSELEAARISWIRKVRVEHIPQFVADAEHLQSIVVALRHILAGYELKQELNRQMSSSLANVHSQILSEYAPLVPEVTTMSYTVVEEAQAAWSELREVLTVLSSLVSPLFSTQTHPIPHPLGPVTGSNLTSSTASTAASAAEVPIDKKGDHNFTDDSPHIKESPTPLFAPGIHQDLPTENARMGAQKRNTTKGSPGTSNDVDDDCVIIEEPGAFLNVPIHRRKIQKTSSGTSTSSSPTASEGKQRENFPPRVSPVKGAPRKRTVDADIIPPLKRRKPTPYTKRSDRHGRAPETRAFCTGEPVGEDTKANDSTTPVHETCEEASTKCEGEAGNAKASSSGETYPRSVEENAKRNDTYTSDTRGTASDRYGGEPEEVGRSVLRTEAVDDQKRSSPDVSGGSTGKCSHKHSPNPDESHKEEVKQGASHATSTRESETSGSNPARATNGRCASGMSAPAQGIYMLGKTFCPRHGDVEKTPDVSSRLPNRYICFICDSEAGDFRAFALKKGFEILKLEYVDASKRWQGSFLCRNGHKATLTQEDITKRPWCPECVNPYPADFHCSFDVSAAQRAQRVLFQRARQNFAAEGIPTSTKPNYSTHRMSRKPTLIPTSLAFTESDVDGHHTIAQLLSCSKNASPWQVLGLEGPSGGKKRWNCNDKVYIEAKCRYKKGVRKVHPDKNAHCDAKEAFYILDAAWKAIEAGTNFS